MCKWDREGWSDLAWDSLTCDVDCLSALLSEFDQAIGRGGGSFDPVQLAEFGHRLEMMANRFKYLAKQFG